MNIEKLQMCRLCLVEDVRMINVTNKDLQILYEKLTDITFLTEDRRPMLACVICYTKLKQCYELQRKCLESEKLLTQMLNECDETKPQINKDPLELVNCVLGEPQSESVDIKEELPDDCEGHNDIISIKEEQTEPEYPGSCLDLEDIPANHSESDSEDDTHLTEFKTEEEPDVSKKKQRAVETQQPECLDSCPDLEDMPTNHSESHSEDNSLLIEFKPKEEPEVSKKKRTASETQNSYPDLEDMPTNHSESDSEDDTPLMEFKTEEEPDISKKKRKAGETKSANDALKPELQTTAHEKKTERNTQRRNTTACSKLKKLSTNPKSISNIVKNTAIAKHERKQNYNCDVCEHSFSSKSKLINHIRIHTGEKPYKCDICQRSFNLVHNLERHKRVHTGEKPYKCDTCQRSFNDVHNLKKHFRVHTGESPYKCEICQKRFKLVENLNKHKRIHTGERPYKCEHCPRSFNDSYNLKIHVRIHTGEQLTKCEICQKTFNQEQNLKRHIRVHTGEKPYKCETCQRSFSDPYNLKIHVFRKHSGDKP